VSEPDNAPTEVVADVIGGEIGHGHRTSTRWVDRRAVFLLCAAVVCVLLIPASPHDLRFVGVVLSIWCTVLAAASWLDQWSRDRS
jgi:hypothetical protein